MKTIEKINLDQLSKVIFKLKKLRRQENNWLTEVNDKNTFVLQSAYDHFEKRDVVWDEIIYRDIPELEFNNSDFELENIEIIEDVSKTKNDSHEKVFRCDEMRWINDNIDYIKHFKGEWLLIEGYRFIASDKNYKILMEIAKSNKIEIPFVYFVPADNYTYVGV